MVATMTPGRGDLSTGDVNPSTVPATAARTDLCIHDLLTVSCIWCTPRPGVVDLGVELDETAGPRTRARAASRWLIASFHGHCNGCGESILPGDTIRRGGGQYVCEDCGAGDG